MSIPTASRESALHAGLVPGSHPGTSVTVPSTVAGSMDPSVHYTCLIRLPFPRNDFVDPPQVDWNSSKDRSLWKVISKASNSKELNWEELSARFDVSLSFLLQQAAWLYERHFAQMRAQMKKLSPSTSSSPIVQDTSSHLPGAVSSATALPMSSQASRAPSSLSIRTRDSPTPTANAGFSAVIRPAGLSRTPSNRTVTQSKVSVPPSPRQPAIKSSFRNSLINQSKPVAPTQEAVEDDSPPPAEASDSSSSDETSSQSMARSQAFRRPQHFSRVGAGSLDSDEDDDEQSSGGFLPFAAAPKADKKEDPAATLRSPQPKRTVPSAAQVFSESSASSTSSAAAGPSQSSGAARPARGPGKTQQTQKSPATALSPRRRAELSKLSPRMKRDGSDGTPSMGSSFSDLDDASISQSALEDAFLSTMQHGAASRISNISQALRSKYL
ncbi:hypothetical protein MBLNU459_g2416t1 [Dothideomycetes sp. NU459]